MRGIRIDYVALLVFGLALAGCSGTSNEAAETAPQPAPADRPSEPRTLQIPGQAPRAADLPSQPPGNQGKRLAWTLPSTWVTETPASSMRLAQYRVPGASGDGECVVYYFGPGQGGDPLSNAHRWAGQFTQPDGSSSVQAMQVSSVDGAATPIDLVEVTGTYDGGMTMTDAPAKSQPNYMLLGAIAQGPDAPWFFKFTGPESTIRAEREAFVRMLQSIHLEP